MDNTDEVDETEALQEHAPRTLAGSVFANALDDLQQGRDIKDSRVYSSGIDARERIARAATHSGTTHVAGVTDRSLRRWKGLVEAGKSFRHKGRPSLIDDETFLWATTEVKRAREAGVPLSPEIGGGLYDLFLKAIARTKAKGKKTDSESNRHRSLFYLFRQSFTIVQGQLKPQDRWAAEHDLRNFVTYAAFLLAELQPYPDSEWTVLARLIASFDATYIKFENYPHPMVVEPNALQDPNKPFERPGTRSMPFRAAAFVTEMASGDIAPLVFVLADKNLGANEVITLEIPGLSPYPDHSGYFLVAQTRTSLAVTGAALRLTLKFLKARTAATAARPGTPGGEERGMMEMDGANEILRALLGHLMVRNKDLTSMDWSNLQAPGSDTDDVPVIYSVDDFDWDEEKEELIDAFAEMRMVCVKTAGGCSGSQAPCDCGACFKCLHAQVKNPRHGDVLDEQVMIAAQRAIDACPAVSHLRSKILHVVAKVSPVLASVFSKHNVQKAFEIPGVYPLDPMRVLNQFAGIQDIPDSLRDHLLSVIHTLADWCRVHPDEPFIPDSLLSELDVPMCDAQRKKEEKGKSRDKFYAMNSQRAGRITRESAKSWTAQKYQQFVHEQEEKIARTKKRAETAASKERKRKHKTALAAARTRTKKHPRQVGKRCSQCRVLETDCQAEGVEWRSCLLCGTAWCIDCIDPAMLRQHTRMCKLEKIDESDTEPMTTLTKRNKRIRIVPSKEQDPDSDSDSDDDLPLLKVELARRMCSRKTATKPQYQESLDSSSEPETEPSSESEDKKSDDDQPKSAETKLKAEKILRESWGPRPGRGVTLKEVYTQRYYKVQFSDKQSKDILAEDHYDGLKGPSADVNAFYSEVLSKWRENHPTPPVLPIPPKPKGPKKAKR